MRRRNVEGSIYQRHDHPSCPEPETIDGRKAWPEHRCRGRWAAAVDMGTVGGKRRRRVVYGETEKEAKALRRKLLREIDDGRLGDDCSLGQWLDHWLAEIAPETMSARTLRNHAGHVTHWIKPELGRLRLTEVRADDVRALRRTLETAHSKRSTGGEPVPLSPTTARYILTTLSSALGAAVTERRITWNPATAVPKPALTGEHHGHWTDPADARAMIDHALDPLEQARFAVALYAGLRQGEALALTWADVDLEARTIDINKTAAYVAGRGMVVTPGAKSIHSVRTVPMHPVVHTLLAALAKINPGPYVFGGAEPRKQSTDYHAWRAGCRRAGLPVISPHGARATTAVLLRAQGVPTSTIGGILGHKPGSTVTELAYAHAQLPELVAAIGRLG